MLTKLKEIWHSITNVDPLDYLFTEQERELYYLLVYNGIIDRNNLSLDYHNKVSGFLEGALYEGFGGDLTTVPFGSSQYEIIRDMRASLYVFSAAKQYQQVREMSAFITIKGEQSLYGDFKKLAGKVFETYNSNYLRTEFNTAVGQAQMAKDWANYQETKDIIPYLTYRTQRDARVRDEHAILDGITLPIDDPFWNTNFPKSGFNCRCFTFASEKARVTDLSTKDLSDLQDERKFPKVFRMNPGKDRLVFNPKYHPYFKVAKGDADFKRANFGLPIP